MLNTSVLKCCYTNMNALASRWIIKLCSKQNKYVCDRTHITRSQDLFCSLLFMGYATAGLARPGLKCACNSSTQLLFLSQIILYCFDIFFRPCQTFNMICWFSRYKNEKKTLHIFIFSNTNDSYYWKKTKDHA